MWDAIPGSKVDDAINFDQFIKFYGRNAFNSSTFQNARERLRQSMHRKHDFTMKEVDAILLAFSKAGQTPPCALDEESFGVIVVELMNAWEAQPPPGVLARFWLELPKLPDAARRASFEDILRWWRSNMCVLVPYSGIFKMFIPAALQDWEDLQAMG